MTPELPPGLWGFLGRYQPSHPDLAPKKLRLHPGVYHRVLAGGHYYGNSRPSNNLLGLDVTPDPTLEPGVWQVYADDDTLLRDSRSTNEVPA